MSRNVRRNFRKLSPIFHERQKEEDDATLSKALIKTALTSGKLNLSGRALSTIPTKLWQIYDTEESELTVDFKSDSSQRDDMWWKQEPLINLDLSSNTLTAIPPNIGNLCFLTVLNLHDNALTTLPKEISLLTKLTRLNISRNKIVNLPQELYLLNELRYLNMSHNSLVELHPDISNLVMLELLDVSHNGLTSLPDGIGFLVRLTEFTINNNKLKGLPEDVVNLRSLRKLDVMTNDIEHFPKGMSELRKLECLYAQHNELQELPDFESSEHLTEIHISNNHIKELPVSFCEGLYKLKIFDLRDNKIEALPSEVSLLQSLVRLDVSNNSLTNLPVSLATLPHLASLQIDGNQIRSIRRDIIQCGTQRILKMLKDRSPDEDVPKHQHFEKAATFPDKFEMRRSHSLTVTSHNINELPEHIFVEAKEEKVQKVDFSKNKFSTLPNGLLHLANDVQELYLSRNIITEIPSFIRDLHKLTYIDLGNNQLTDLPAELKCLEHLRELNLSYNKLMKIPDCIFSLSSLEILLLRDNKIEKLDASHSGLGALKKLSTLDLANNNIDAIPPIIGKMTNIRTLDIVGNRFRQPRHQILEKGTDAIMMYLRDRIPD